jgi:hypothetical protein
LLLHSLLLVLLLGLIACCAELRYGCDAELCWCDVSSSLQVLQHGLLLVLLAMAKVCYSLKARGWNELRCV